MVTVTTVQLEEQLQAELTQAADQAEQDTSIL